MKSNMYKLPTETWLMLYILLDGEKISETDLEDCLCLSDPRASSHFLRVEYLVPIDTEIEPLMDSDGEQYNNTIFRISPTELAAQQERFGYTG